jgi:ribosomal protein L29
MGMNFSEIEKMDIEAAKAEVSELRKQIVKLRFDVVSNKLKDLKQIKKKKKEIARLLTHVNQVGDKK